MALPISQGSGATLASNIIGGAHYQIISPVSLSGLVSLPSGTTILTQEQNLISLASGTKILADQDGIWNVGVTGLVSLASGTQVLANQSGQWDIRSALSLASVYGEVKVTNTVPVTGTFWQTTQPISGNVGITGLVSLASGTQITTVSNNLTSLASGTQIIANQGGTWDVRSVLSLASIYGNVGITGTPTVNVNGLISLASGTNVLTSFSGLISLASGTNVLATQNGSWDIRSLLSTATIYAVVNTGAANGVTSLASGQEIRSLATILNWPATQTVQLTGLVSLASGTSVLTSFGGVISLASGTNVLIGNSLVTVTLGTKLDSVNDSISVGNLISLASGTNILATQSGSWDIRSLLSTATIYAVVNTGAVNGVTSLASGQEIRSLATIMNWPATQPISYNGLISLASGTSVLTSFSGIISLASGTQIITSTNNLTSLASGTNILATQSGNWDIRSLLSTATIYAVVNTGAVNGVTSLASGQEIRSLATILNFPATQTVSFNQLVSLASGTNVLANFGGVISLASGQLIQVGDNGGSITVDNAGTWDVRSVLSLASIYGNVGITGTPTVNVNGLISLASGTSVLTSFSGLISLASGTHIIVDSGAINANQNGTWTVQPGNTANTTPWLVTQSAGLISLASGTQVITSTTNLTSLASGTNILATQSGSWDIRSALSLASIYGKVDIITAPTLTVNTHAVTQSGAWGVGASLATTQVIGSLNSLASIYGSVGNAAGANFIGLATIVPGFTPVSANYTSFATLITASGAASLFAPPNNQRWVLKDLIIGSAANNVVNIQSGGSIVLIPYMSLATMGGYISNFGESGLRADAVNSAFVINTKSTATLSVFANVRFDPS